MNIVPIIGLVVALFLYYGSTNSDYKEDRYSWIDYFKDEVRDEPLKFVNLSLTLQDAQFKEAQPTASYEQPKRFYLNFDVPYFVLLYSGKTFNTLRTGMCGGVLLTPNVVMTLCSCVETYIHWKMTREGLKPAFTPRTLPEDMGQTIYVAIETKNFSFINTIDIKKYYIRNNYTVLNFPEEKQLINEQCLEAYKIPTSFWLQRTAIALLIIKPNYTKNAQNIFMPWPPRPFLYDLTLKDKGVDPTNFHWGLHYARSPVTVVIPSFNYDLNNGPFKVFRDALGQVINVGTTLVHFPTTLCDQDFCESDFHDFLPKDQSPRNERRKIGCFCDQNLDNTVCNGLVGSPIIHDGAVYGLLTAPLHCNKDRPRRTLGYAITVETMDYITQKVPEIFDRLGKKANSSKFRDNAIVSNYEINIPEGELLPPVIPFSDDDAKGLLGHSGTHFSRPSEPTTLLLLGFVFIFLVPN